jgi:hypothetical protein
MAKNFEKLIFGGLHEKHAGQRGIWVPTQHSLWDQGKPWSSWTHRSLGGWVGTRTGTDAVEKRELMPLPGVPVCSQSLYRLSHLGSIQLVEQRLGNFVFSKEWKATRAATAWLCKQRTRSLRPQPELRLGRAMQAQSKRCEAFSNVIDTRSNYVYHLA